MKKPWNEQPLALLLLLCGLCAGMLLPRGNGQPSPAAEQPYAVAALSYAVVDEPSASAPLEADFGATETPSAGLPASAQPSAPPAASPSPPAAPPTVGLSQPATPARESLFAVTKAPQSRFAIQVVREEAERPKRVLIYHTHTFEAYQKTENANYSETETWRTADERFNVVRVGEELAALLRGLGVDVTHDATAFEPPDLSSAYARSLEMLEKRTAAGEGYDLYIDLHRDAYGAAQSQNNTVRAGSVELARLMLLIGRGDGQTSEDYALKPDWERNLRIASSITDGLNAQQSGLCKNVMVKSGRYNQHVAPCCILVEAGNNHNTLEQALAAMPYLADAVYDALQSPEIAE